MTSEEKMQAKLDENRNKEKNELSETQIHFMFSNEPLIDGIPLSKYKLLKEQGKKDE